MWLSRVRPYMTGPRAPGECILVRELPVLNQIKRRKVKHRTPWRGKPVGANFQPPHETKIPLVNRGPLQGGYYVGQKLIATVTTR
jgi:hypothetical protein